MILHMYRNLQCKVYNHVHARDPWTMRPLLTSCTRTASHPVSHSSSSFFESPPPCSPKRRVHSILHIQLLFGALLKTLITVSTILVPVQFPALFRATTKNKTHPPQILHRLVQRRRKNTPNVTEQGFVRLQLELLAQGCDEHLEAMRSR